MALHNRTQRELRTFPVAENRVAVGVNAITGDLIFASPENMPALRRPSADDPPDAIRVLVTNDPKSADNGLWVIHAGVAPAPIQQQPKSADPLDNVEGVASWTMTQGKTFHGISGIIEHETYDLRGPDGNVASAEAHRAFFAALAAKQAAIYPPGFLSNIAEEMTENIAAAIREAKRFVYQSGESIPRGYHQLVESVNFRSNMKLSSEQLRDVMAATVPTMSPATNETIATWLTKINRMIERVAADTMLDSDKRPFATARRAAVMHAAEAYPEFTRYDAEGVVHATDEYEALRGGDRKPRVEAMGYLETVRKIGYKSEILGAAVDAYERARGMR